MDTLQMKYFVTAAKCLNFTEAANQLFISQPTLSRQITAIESELNMQLFIRDKRSVRLTPAGEYLYHKLSALYQEYCEIVDHARDKSTGFSGNLNIGVLDGHIISDFFPDILKSCNSQYPNLKINLARGSFRQLTDGLYSGIYDLVITLSFDIMKKEKLSFFSIDKTVDCIAMHYTHPMAERESVYLSDFKEDTFLLISPEDSTEPALRVPELCKQEGFYPNIKYAPNLETVMLWVEAGMGVAIINNYNSLSQNSNVRLVPCASLSHFELVAAWYQESNNPAISIMLEEMKKRKLKS